MRVPKQFYYITHIDNLKSILKEGILSHSQINKNEKSILAKLGWTAKIRSIHAEDVIQIRKNRQHRFSS